MARYIIYKTLGKLKVQNQDVPKTEIDLLTNNFEMFLGPRGPLRTPLVPVVPSSVVPSSRPQQKFTQPLIISFPSDSKLKQPLPQYTVHRTLNRINSRTFLAQFGLVTFLLFHVNF